MSKVAVKRLTTVRLNPEDFEKVKKLTDREQTTPAEVIRKAVHIGIVSLPGGEEEDALIRRRLAQKVKDIDGESFLKALKKEFHLS